MTAGALRRLPPRAVTWPAASKVPEVTAAFWITKVLTTGMGEATSDYLVRQISPVIAVGLGAVGLATALALQFAVRRYVTWIYWLAVVMVAIFGTMAADVLHVALHVPYTLSTAGFSAALALVFAVWYRSERTLSIHSIVTRRREMFYWATVMATFALGTAAGDLTAATLGLGWFGSGVLFAVVIAVPAIARWGLRLNAVVAFWFAYIVTRPLGASFADWLGVPHSWGGLGYGRGSVSLVSTIMIAGMVAYLSVTGRRASTRQPASAPPLAGTPQPARTSAPARTARPGGAPQPARPAGGRHRAGREHRW